jgi:hypothetical protein
MFWYLSCLEMPYSHKIRFLECETDHLMFVCYHHSICDMMRLVGMRKLLASSVTTLFAIFA